MNIISETRLVIRFLSI